MYFLMLFGAAVLLYIPMCIGRHIGVPFLLRPFALIPIAVVAAYAYNLLHHILL